MKILSFSELAKLRDERPDQSIVLCHGVFDVLHAGHLAYFQSARKFGDILVVTITADPFVNKGPGRPYFSGKIRCEMVAALECVDYVALNPHPTAVPVIRALRPTFYVKGPDYKNKSADPTGAIFEEESAVIQAGGSLVFTDDDTHSSSELLNKFFQPWTEEQQKTIAEIKRCGGLARIEQVFEKLSELSVIVAGEPIIDTYVFCQPENISSKSPSISARFIYEENYAGGALAIANHLVDFVKDLRLTFTHGGEPLFQTLLAEKIDPRIDLAAHEIRQLPTPRKTRFMTISESQRLFELTDLRFDQWAHHNPEEFSKTLLSSANGSTATILADFGHGLFESSVLASLRDLPGFVGLNVQTNSSNFGFNPFNKHTRFDYLSVDSREVRVAYHDRLSPVLTLAHRLRKEIRSHGASASITLGSQGSIYFPADTDREHPAPAFADKVIDATGAGDAYFALTALLVKVGCPSEMVPFIGNVFAGLKTKIIGNKSAVSRSQLFKALTAILK